MVIKQNIKKIIISCLMLVFVAGFTAKASMVITVYQSLQTQGTSGSAYRNVAQATQSAPNNTYLYSGIRRGSSSGYTYGNPAGGNIIYVTAYSPYMAGAYNQLSGTAFVR
ncbi:hypothetical protein M2145_002898 [Lachnospiraceae bacterium PF1-21]|uniref:Uncharacterized protein n=1 Tax=Ohessyouella blattaphilus TaxID=2949333 RepID=A0ABT1ELC9_9FIRM|nr:hypothetical protein [Ohessyouella blattaphilus]MCP1111513.1 hypothetical protein [Ohessyouella blattaphilus]MCR8564907.1 hypothetical protein [Ohessyouella blattaphilus]